MLKTILEERYLYLLGLLGLAVGLPLGRAIISVSLFVLLGAFLIDGIYRNDFLLKWERFKQHKFAVAITGIFILHLLGLIHTVDLDYALKDLRIKLPLLFLPFIFAGLPSLTEKQRNLILYIHVPAVMLSTLISVIHYKLHASEGQSPREYILFCSHIRLSLMVVMSMLISLYFALKKGWFFRVMAVGIVLWSTLFLTKIQAATGIGILLVCAGLSVVIWSIKARSKALPLSVMTLMILFTLLYLGKIYTDYYEVHEPDWDSLEETTAQGNPYHHARDNKMLEHGHYVWTYYSAKEMREAWNKRSSLTLGGTDQMSEGRVVRYLNAKGLRKDAAGVNALSDTDVENIEEGMTCPPELLKSGFEQRLHMLLFELNAYANGNDPTGNSLTQRFEYWKAAWSIGKRNALIGVGTGDVPMAFETEYQHNGTKLKKEFRNRAHNQYLTIFLTFGFLGFLIFLIFLYYPLSDLRVRGDPLYMLFVLVLSMSFLTEDTLETQQGLSFFIFYSGVLLLSKCQAPEQSSS